MKMWSGRFQKNTDALVNDFNSSVMFDSRMYREDIAGSIAHAAMLGETGVVDVADVKKIICGLNEVLADIENGSVELSLENEDIHMNVESILTQKIGDAGKKLHTARSRNDQVALDLRMYIKKEIQEILKLIVNMMEALVKKSEENMDAVMPGYTHLQRAQPVTFGHYMMAYANMFCRDYTRLEDCFSRMDEMPLGSGALAATTYDIDRDSVRDKLGFARITQNSLDGVSDRDFAIELCSDISILMMHLSRFSEEIIMWCSWEFRFIELDDAFSTGSSIMPQKKNPDVAELVRGKTGRVYGSLITLLTVMKALPLAYNKDMQEDKEAVFDAVDTVKNCLAVFTPMFETIRINKSSMRNAASKGFINATDCADFLVRQGLPFRDAYMIVGKLVYMCIENDKTLETLTMDDFLSVSPAFDENIYEAISLDTCVNKRKVYGGPAKESVIGQINYIKDFIAKKTGDLL